LNPEKNDSRRTVRWDIDNARQNYAALIVAQGGLAAASFLCVWIITHYLGAEPYGNIAAFMAAAQLAQVALWWTLNAMVRFGVQEFVESGQISHSFWSRTIVLGVNLVLFFGTLPLWLPVFASGFKLSSDIIPTILVYLFVSAIWLHLQFAMQAAKLPIRLAMYQMSERLLTLLIIGFLVVIGALTWQRAAAAYVISPGALIVFGIYSLRQVVDWRFWRFGIDYGRIKRIIKFSIPIPLNSLLSPLALNYVGTLFILHYLTKGDLGEFALAFQLYGLVMVLPVLAGSLMTPLFISSRSNKGAETLTAVFLKEVLPAMTVLFSIGATILAVAIYYLMPIVFGGQFSNAGQVLWILLAAGSIAAPVFIGFFPLTLSGDSTYIQLIPAALSTIALIAVSFILVPRYGLLGSAWSTLISYAVILAIFSVLIHRREGLGVSKTLVVGLTSALGALAVTIGTPVVGSAFIVLGCLLLIVLLDRYTYARGFNKLRMVLVR
jgi:O-antigen/teichoic acid export membrane protein